MFGFVFIFVFFVLMMYWIDDDNILMFALLVANRPFCMKFDLIWFDSLLSTIAKPPLLLLIGLMSS